MEAVLLVIHLIIALAIIVIVMVQPSESGGFMGSSGSMSNLGMPRRSADVMTRATTILAGCFFMTSLLLAIAAGHQPAPKSILDAAGDEPVIEAPAKEEGAKAPAAPKAPIAK
jgi:preprotein translocase subunit SecG